MNILLLGSNGAIGSNFLKLHLNNKKINKIYSIDLDKNVLIKKNLLKNHKHIFLRHNLEKSSGIKLKKKNYFDCAIFLSFNTQFKNYEEYEYYIKNMKIFYNSLEIIRKLEIKKIVYASSFAVYGDLTAKKLNEKSKRKKVDIYSELKIDCENLIQRLSINNFNFRILRFSQVFGADIYTNIIANFLNMKKNNKTVTLFGNGLQYRDFISIEDVCEAIMKASILKSNKNYILNICSGKMFSILSIVKIIGLKYILKKELRGPKKVFGSNLLAKKTLNWTPKINLEKFLKNNI